MTVRPLFLMIAALLAGPFLLATTARAQVVDTAPPVDVLVWTTWSGPSLEWLQQQLAVFARAGNLKVQVEEFTLGELRSGVVVPAEDMRGPDVLVGVPHDELAELVSGGLLLNMRSFATGEYLADLPPQAALAFDWSGELLGLPLALEGPALIVNTALADSLPADYAGFLESARAAGFSFDFGNFYFAYAWFRGHGAGGVGQADAPDLWLSQHEAIQAAQALQALRFDLNLIEAGTDYYEAHSAFAAGEKAFTFNGPWAVASYFEAGVPLTVMPMPRVAPDLPFAGFMSVHGVLVTSAAQSRTHAVNVAKWLVRAESQFQLAQTAGRIPASLSAVDRLEDDDVLHGFGVALRHAEAVPNSELMAATWQPMGRLLQELDEAPLTESQIRELLDVTRDAVNGL